MANNVIYKNKGEVFNCSFDVDGADPDDIEVRLCLEFNDNKNMFFYGQMNADGESCTITIPRLAELDDKQGNLRVEAIIDDTYFKLYECPVELKNSVQMKIKESTGTFFNSSDSNGAKVQFATLTKETPKKAPKEEVFEEEEFEEVEVAEEKPEKDKGLRTFDQYMSSKKTEEVERPKPKKKAKPVVNEESTPKPPKNPYIPN